MGIRNSVLRAVVGGALASTCLSAGTALAALAPQDTVLTLTQVTNQDLKVTSSESIQFGNTADYAITVTNGGSFDAPDVALSKVVLPPAPMGTQVLKLAGVSGATCKADSTGHIPLAADGTILGVDADGKATTTPAPCPFTTATIPNDPGPFTAWAPDTIYEAGAVVQNGGFFFTTVAGGRSAAIPSTGPAPTGPAPGSLADGTVTWVDTLPGNAVQLTITVEWALPDPDAKGKVTLPVNDACPTPDSMGAVKVEVTSNTTHSPATGTFPGMAVDEWADVEATLDGPTNGSVGQSAEFTHTVTNHGPCTATNVIASFFPNINISTILTFQSGPASGVCAGVNPISDGVCPLGDLAKGQTQTWKDTYKLGSLPESVTQTTIPYEFDAYSYTTALDKNGDPQGPPFSSKKVGIWDPDTGNNDVNADGIRIGKEGGGCSSGGPGGLSAIALMAAAVFAARRRRTA